LMAGSVRMKQLTRRLEIDGVLEVVEGAAA
jgi:hypothetical protein